MTAGWTLNFEMLFYAVLAVSLFFIANPSAFLGQPQLSRSPPVAAAQVSADRTPAPEPPR